MIRLFRVFFPKSIVGLITSETILLFLIFLSSVYIINPVEADTFLWYEGGLASIVPVVLIALLALYFNDLYTEVQIRSVVVLVQQYLQTVGIIFLSQALLAYVDRELMLSRPMLIVGCALLLFVLPLWRIAYTRVIYKGFGTENILFLGTHPVAREIAETVGQHAELGFHIQGFLLEPEEEGATEIAGVPAPGLVSDVLAVSQKLRPDRIVISMSERRSRLPIYDLLDLRFSGVPIEEVSLTYETVFGRVPLRTLKPSLLFLSQFGPSHWTIRVQTVFSFIVALVGATVLLPVMLLVALAVRLTSAGPALYAQRRVGYRGAPFTVYKFRSMVVNAESGTGAVWASRNDPRITPLGRFIRKTRLDELPQLFNVLRGDMSIVGPRPERPEFVKTLSEQIPFYPQRHAVKPGLTGWAQINYKYGDTLEDTIVKLEYDLYYIKHVSVWLDMYIMFQTMKTMLLTRGAH